MSQAYLDKIKPGAIRGWETNKILPSVTAAQAILESGWGSSRLAQPPYNNNFGIKASPDWTGRTVTMPTREYVGGRNIMINASFRAYDTLADSIADHALFFTNTAWRKNNYKYVIGETDYRKACRALQSAGYATDPQYANSLIRLIDQYNLNRWDEEAMNASSYRPNTSTRSNQPTNTGAFKPGVKRVGGQMSKESVNTLKRSTVTVLGDHHASEIFRGMKPKVKDGNRYSLSHMELGQIASGFNNPKEVVIVAAGTYGVATQSQLDEILRIAGDRKVILVDTGADTDNAYAVSALYQSNSATKSNVYWCDWYRYSEPMRNQWYEAEGENGKKTMLSPEGKGELVRYVIQALHEAVTGDFGSRVAQNTKEKLLTVRTIKLEANGMLYFPAYDINGKQVEGSQQTKLRGLYSPYGDEYIYNSVAQQQFGIPTADGKSIWIDAEYKNNDLEEGYKLMEEGAEALLKLSQPAAQYTVDLNEVPKDLSIGDTGLFIDHEFDPPLYIQARVLSITTSRSNPGRNKVVIGNVIELHPRPKPEIKQMQQELASSYEAMKGELIENRPTSITLETSNGTLISEKSETTILATVLQENINITDRFKFVWSRSSGNSEADEAFNQQLAESFQGSVLTVRFSDLGAKECKFTVTIYDTKGNLINSEDISLKEARSGKSAYELALDQGFSGSISDWIKSLHGKDGDDGIPGEKGEDGQTTYIHIAYANSPTGKDFTTSKQTGKEYAYIGQYSDLIKEDSTDYRKYSWAYIKGEQGEKGKNSYLHFAYADKDDDGNFINFSTTDENRDWKGYYSSNESYQSKDPKRYTWEKSPKVLERDISRRALDEDLNKVISEQTSLAVALKGKMDEVAFNKQIKEYEEFIQTTRTDAKNAEFIAKQVQNATIKTQEDLKDQAKRLTTLDGFVQVDGKTNSFSIANSSANTQVILDDEGLKFIDGGVTVGVISKQYLEIMRGIFAKSIQIGRHKIEPLASDQRHLLVTYLGEGDK